MAASRRPKRFRPLWWLIAVLSMLMAILAVPTSVSAAGPQDSGALTLDQGTYIHGYSQQLKATYYTSYSSDGQNVSDVNQDWIGIYKALDTPGTNWSQTWQWAPNLTGTVTLDIGSLPAGSYKAYLFYNNTYTTIAPPVDFDISSNALSLDQSSYTQGSSINVQWSTTQPYWYNWVAIVPAAASPGSSNYQRCCWKYVSSSGTSGNTSVPTAGLTVGKWDVYLLKDGGYTQLAGPVRFTVVPAYDHVFMIMMENTSYSDLNAATDPLSTTMPNLKRYKPMGTWFSNYHGVTHPSDQNYSAIAGGDTYNTGKVYFPNVQNPHKNIADKLEGIGKSWRAYDEGNGPTSCDATTTSHATPPDQYYAPDDEPFVNYTDVVGTPPSATDRCSAHVFDTTQLTQDLGSTSTTPAFSWVAPDDWNNGEQSRWYPQNLTISLQAQDKWLGTTVDQITHSPAWTQQRSLLIITWDEDYPYSANNQVPALVLGSQGVTAKKIGASARYDHYSTGRTIECALGIAPIMSNDWGATPLVDAFTP